MNTRKIEGSIVTITGGTGSFGSTMTRHLLDNGVGEVRIFSRDEAKQDSMRHTFSDHRIRFYLGDVRDQASVGSAVKGADMLFHAAALKQVPSAEFFPLEAVATNIQGSANVLRASIEAGLKSAVFLSTDKAVYPINAMGMSKALMEKTVLSFARNGQSGDTKVAVTRYGNVIASRGSVIPLVMGQIKSGKPVTVTDPRMTRFLMSLEDSVDLVHYALQNSENGDLLVRKAPAATVADLVKAICELLDRPDCEVKVIGVRHGEKIHESLLSSEEKGRSIDQGDYYSVPLDSRNLDYGLYFDEGSVSANTPDAYNSSNTQRLNVAEIKALLVKLPEVQALL